MRKTNPKKKAWNLSPHPLLRKFVEEFVQLNGRSSATAVVEEALREFFERKGIKVGATPEDVVKAVARDEKAEGKHDAK